MAILDEQTPEPPTTREGAMMLRQTLREAVDNCQHSTEQCRSIVKMFGRQNLIDVLGQEDASQMMVIFNKLRDVVRLATGVDEDPLPGE